MVRKNIDLVIIGGGSAGMAAAVAAKECGITNLLIIERSKYLGGILRQCIHNGFGLHTFGEELTGPEYVSKYEAKVKEFDVPYMTETMVLSLTPDKVVTATNQKDGIFEIQAKAVILAMGCRERPRGALNTAGTRPSGVFTAGTAQKFINLKGYMPGKEVVILGSGDIGLIMARRMTLEGAKVKAVCELMPYSGGLARNIQQCLKDFGIPLKLSHTVLKIHGKERLEGVTIAKVDENRRPIMETAEYIPCDTLLLSVGLIPENELTRGAGIEMDRVTNGAKVNEERETSIEGVYACGNVLHVHDLVDYVSEEADIAGRAAARYIKGECERNSKITLVTDGRVRYTVPQYIKGRNDATVYFRVGDVFRNATLVVKDGEKVIFSKKKQKFAPGEMESITLKGDLLKALETDTLNFSLEV